MKIKARERDIEGYLVKKVREARGKAFKFSSPGNRGVPDRICFFPHNTIVLVEVKAPGRKLRPLQIRVAQLLLSSFNIEVLVIDSKETVNKFIEAMKNEAPPIPKESH